MSTDGAISRRSARNGGESLLPADPGTIRAFIEHEVNAGKKPATVRRYIATIGRAHIGAGLLNPCSGEAVRLGLKKMGRETSARQNLRGGPRMRGPRLRSRDFGGIDYGFGQSACAVYSDLAF
jgi:hypothetical protein